MGRVYNLTSSVIEGGLKLSSIEVQTPPTKTDYIVGERFIPDGMVIQANFTNGVTSTVTGYKYAPTTLTYDDDHVTITYSIGGVTATVDQAVSVTRKVAQLPWSYSLKYTGLPQSPTYPLYDPELMSIGEDSILEATEVGQYYFTFIPHDDVEWTDGLAVPKKSPWVIHKADGTLSLSKDTLSFMTTDSSANVVAYGTGGAITATSSDEEIATVAVYASTITVTAKAKAGTCTITVERAETDHYKAVSATITVTKHGYIQVADYDTAGTYTYTIPENGNYKAVVIGAGGGGGAGGLGGLKSPTVVGGSGGGGGSSGELLASDMITYQGDIEVSIVVGKGGAGASTTQYYGESGGSSSAFGVSSRGGGRGWSGDRKKGLGTISVGDGGYRGEIENSTAYSVGGTGYPSDPDASPSTRGATYSISSPASITVYGGNGGGCGDLFYVDVPSTENSGRYGGTNGGGGVGGSGGYHNYSNDTISTTLAEDGKAPTIAGSGGGGGGGSGVRYGSFGHGSDGNGAGGSGSDGRVIIFRYI